MTAGLPLGAGALPSGREILILNRGEEAIFRISIGHAESGVWSADVLPFNEVIDIGEGRTLKLPVGNECLYDVRASYRDGDVEAISGIDLCDVTSLSFNH